MQGIVIGRADINFPDSFFGIFNGELKNKIAFQCLDLRSSVSKEACLTIEIINALINNKEIMAANDSFVDALIKMIGRGDKIMVDLGKQVFFKTCNIFRLY